MVTTEDKPTEQIPAAEITKNPTVNQFENIKAPDYRTVYANNAVFQTGPFDFSFIFGEVMEINAERPVGIVHQRVRVTMAPLHVKIFMLLLAQQIRGFEAEFGKINLPSSILTPP